MTQKKRPRRVSLPHEAHSLPSGEIFSLTASPELADRGGGPSYMPTADVGLGTRDKKKWSPTWLTVVKTKPQWHGWPVRRPFPGPSRPLPSHLVIRHCLPQKRGSTTRPGRTPDLLPPSPNPAQRDMVRPPSIHSQASPLSHKRGAAEPPCGSLPAAAPFPFCGDPDPRDRGGLTDSSLRLAGRRRWSRAARLRCVTQNSPTAAGPRTTDPLWCFRSKVNPASADLVWLR